jgi:hypothetical protein
MKMESSDGKQYKTHVADTEQLFRLIQSIPSPKAEPFKSWLAQVAAERLDEMQDPEGLWLFTAKAPKAQRVFSFDFSSLLCG